MRRTLGKAGIEVSPLGMGCWAIGGPWDWVGRDGARRPVGWGDVDDQESVRAIRAAIDNGITFFDTAANYGAGHSEIILGQALRGRRDEVVVATKFGHIVDEAAKAVRDDDQLVLQNIEFDVENSLRRLDIEVIDLYQLHVGEYDPDQAPAVRQALERLVAGGKIRSYGWSTDLPDRARVFADGENCAAIQFGFNVINDNPEARRVCAEFGVAGINKDPLNKGFLTGKFSGESRFASNDLRSSLDFSDQFVIDRLRLVESLRPILTDGGRTMAQGALGYIWAKDPNMIPIPGIRTVAQAEENARAMSLGPLAPETVAEADRIVAAAREGK